jgi:hypothetical protein
MTPGSAAAIFESLYVVTGEALESAESMVRYTSDNAALQHKTRNFCPAKCLRIRLLSSKSLRIKFLHAVLREISNLQEKRGGGWNYLKSKHFL